MEPVDYTHLPPPIRPEDMIAEVDTRAVPDPEAGQNTDQLMTLRYAAV
jgi:hypothetical protein